MWIAILGGLAAGLLIAMFFVLRAERGYRVLFSDTHLDALARAIAASRDGTERTTFEGVTVAWDRLPEHLALTFATKRALAPTAARFLLAFAIELARATPIASLQVGPRKFALVWTQDAGETIGAAAATGATSALVPDGGLDETSLLRMRAAAADAMTTLPLTQAGLAAYR